MTRETGMDVLPALQADTKTSFYPYPISARTELNKTLQPLRGPACASGSRPSPYASAHSSSEHVSARKRLARATRRAVLGKRPAGTGLGREAEELSEEEEMMIIERDHFNQFGHRFLLPIGRRQTQMEVDNAPSPTPSDADHGRQEDHGVPSPQIPPTANDEEGEDPDGPGGELDLDASIEDLDADVEDLDDEGLEDEEEEEDGENEGPD